MNRYDGLLIFCFILLGLYAGYEAVEWIILRYQTWRKSREKPGFDVLPPPNEKAPRNRS